MEKTAIIKQLDKALEEKDNEKLRLRISMLVDILENSAMLGLEPARPSTPTLPYYEKRWLDNGDKLLITKPTC